MEPYRIDFAALPWRTPLPGVRCRAYQDAGWQLRLVEYLPSMPPHWCEKGHIGCILAGRFEIEFEGQTVVFNAGDGVFIPPGRAHRHRARAVSEIVRAMFVEEA